MTGCGIIAPMEADPGTRAAAPPDDLVEALQHHFGHDAFRPGQREVVDAVCGGVDVVLVMPTGGGKSLCYQLPAVLDASPTIVVSPLIALMKDQVDGLRALGIACGSLHSGMDRAEQWAVAGAYRAGALPLLHVAPERLVRQDFRELLEARRPGRIVVDEAHCISEWGHDFRRDYLRIGEVAASLRPVQIVACTATATATVRRDIASRLELRNPSVFVHGFSRPNLTLRAHRLRDEAEKLARLDSILDPADGHSIIYAGTRARAQAIWERIRDRIPTALYHADLDPERRAAAQDRFASGRDRVVVATSAFGMGVDVPTVRQVIHLALPSSLEEYYQQAGRAGRDGCPATCTVLHAPADRRLPEFFIDAAHPDAGTIATVHRLLIAHASRGGPGSFTGRGVGISDAAVETVRGLLRDAGVIHEDGSVDDVPSHMVPVDHERLAAHKRLALERFSHLVTYLAGGRCRHSVIAGYFGDADMLAACGDRCDVCVGDASPTGPQLDALPIRQALSAVARLNGRVGMAKMAAILAGSRRRDIEEIRGATKIPTFGVLRHWREPDIHELLRRLVDAGALIQTPPYLTVAITRIGADAMRGDHALTVADPRAGRGQTSRGLGPRRAVPAMHTDLDDAAAERAGRLRRWRTAAARDRSVPAYVVMNDRTLAEVASRAPADAASLLAVPGIGPAKVALYGETILELIAGRAT